MPWLTLLAALALVPQDAQRVSPAVRAARNLGPAVVNVSCSDERGQRASLGSGLVIDPEGWIVTAADVVADLRGPSRPDGLCVRLADGSEHAAALVDVDLGARLAVLRIDARRLLPTVTLGSSGDLMVGETLIAVSNSGGATAEVRHGLVSRVVRDETIQLDTHLPPHARGAPMANVLGEIVALAGADEAVPIDRVKLSLQRLLDPRRHKGLDSGLHMLRGSIVLQLSPDGPAERAGLREGDRLVRLQGRAIVGEFDVLKEFFAARPGQRLPLRVERGTNMMDLELELELSSSPRMVVHRALGVDAFDHPRWSGVWIGQVHPDGAAARLTLEPGDIIDGVGDLLVDDVPGLAAILQAQPPGAVVPLAGFRRGHGFRGEIELPWN